MDATGERGRTVCHVLQLAWNGEGPELRFSYRIHGCSERQLKFRTCAVMHLVN
jgi:hypothetical protein